MCLRENQDEKINNYYIQIHNCANYIYSKTLPFSFRNHKDNIPLRTAMTETSWES